jgi:O-acetyl-ADP-ribose deacetylase (regulator of RNase III)
MLDELWLIHPEKAMISAFEERFAMLPRVRCFQGRFEAMPTVDAFVTAGNAFGLMTAGIDAAVIHRLGESLMHRIQEVILDRYFGEQPVGTAFLIETHDATLPYLIHAPTMRVPGNIEGTDNIYAATWAALLCVAEHNAKGLPRLERVAFPAMGTGFGGVPYREAARQMAVAYRHFLEPPHRLDWDFVAERQLAICYDEGRQVVRPR